MHKGRTAHQGNAQLSKKQLDAVQSADRMSLVERVFLMVSSYVRQGDIAAGHRMPSVRQLAKACEISADTVARAYDKLVAHGHLESRAGSGFYVRAGSGQAPPTPERAARGNGILSGWKEFRPLQPHHAHVGMLGSGLFPADWLDEQSTLARLLFGIRNI